MSSLSEKIANLLEYAGVRSASYYHAHTPKAYDANDPLPYFVDESRRADYRGPHDDNGLPLYVYGGKPIYLPVFLCFWGLGHLDLFRKTSRQEHLDNFLKVVGWLTQNQRAEGDWLTPTPMKKFGLLKPFPSAMVQGLAVSCLVRGYHIANDQPLLHSAVEALKPFHKEVLDGGVTSYHEGLKFFEEYPAHPSHHVLNGFIYALWGLHDLARTGDEDAHRLYNDGVGTLEAWLPRYDLGYWSLYHLSGGLRNPATIHYHRLHVDQLDVMMTLTGNPLIAEYHDRWQGYLDSPLGALRTLPAKLRWRMFYAPTIPPQ